MAEAACFRGQGQAKESTMITRTAEQLHTVVRRILLAAGASEANADCVAEHLVRANLSGVDTHGIWPIPLYVKAVRDGEIDPVAEPTVLRRDATSALVSGNWTFGHPPAKRATQLAIDLAKKSNIAVVGLVQSHHIGRVGHYVELAAMVFASGYSEEAPATVPFGGRQRVLHTNPIAMGLPCGEGQASGPMMFDFATTMLSGVKVENARSRGRQLPPNCIVDKHGNFTTDPNEFFDGGGHVPFGGHKGYALVMMCEYLGRILTGADAYAQPGRGGAVMGHQGVSFIVFKADVFRPFEEFAASSKEMAQRVRDVPPAPGFDRVMAPGDPEAQTRAKRRRDGIPIKNDIWKSLVDTAASLGIDDL